MKRLWYGLLLALGVCAGCVWLPKLPDKPSAAPPQAATVTKSARPTMRVTADRVNETNAREQAQALQEELDRDSEANEGPH
jgi:hypothetical protein